MPPTRDAYPRPFRKLGLEYRIADGAALPLIRKGETTMRKFLCTHTQPVETFSLRKIRQLIEASHRDANVRGYRAFLNLTEGKACCIIEADDRDAILDWFRQNGIPFDSIVPVEFESYLGVVEDLRQTPVNAST